jgi:hypothetical protein
MVLHECPFCHRPFEAELLSKEQVDSSERSRVSDFPVERALGGQLSEGGMYFSPMFGPTDDEKAAVAMRPEAFLTFKETYKCKHCGKEWTKLSVEEKRIPREYLEDEREKTDYDAHIEEEEAREEEYARK